jgi:hypothetical protein
MHHPIITSSRGDWWTRQKVFAWPTVWNAVKRQSAGEITTVESAGEVIGRAVGLRRREKNELKVWVMRWAPRAKTKVKHSRGIGQGPPRAARPQGGRTS